METNPSNDDETMGGRHSLSTWARVYLHGVIAFVVICAIAYVVTLLAPIFDFGNRGVAVALSVIAILAGPPIFGSIILFGVLPMLGKKEGLRGLLVWDDRLLTEVADAKEKAQIVIINWPSDKVRTMGVLTSTFSTHDASEKSAAVYVPTAPQTKLGYIRIVNLDEVEFTDWTFQQWQLYQLTFGSVAPDHTTIVADE